MAVLALLAGAARAQPAPQLRPKRRDDVAVYADDGRQSARQRSFRYSQRRLQPCRLEVPGSGRGGVRRAARSDRRHQSGNCVAKLTNASSSALVQTANRLLTLSPGFYSVRCNIAATGNNSALMSLQYIPAGNGTPPTSVKLVLGTDPNDPANHTSSLRTVMTGGSSPDSFCINLRIQQVSAVTNPNDCHASEWAHQLASS